MSGWLLLGLPGALYLGGLSEGWIAVGLILGAWANWKFVAGPLRVYTERTKNALTLPDYFTHRFDDRSRMLRVLSALVILVFFAVYCASGIVAGARLFESVFGVPYAQALWWGAAATILYTLIGGFLAVSWTDTVQASLMIFALVLTPVMVIIGTGGFDESMAAIRASRSGEAGSVQGRRARLRRHRVAAGVGPRVFRAAAHPGALHGGRRPALDPEGAPHRHDVDGAVPVRRDGGGLLRHRVFRRASRRGETVKDNPERVFIVLSNLLFNPWIAGVLLSAILAAIMSTLSCQLLVCSSALTEDFYKGFLRPKAGQRELVWFGRAMVLAVSLLAIWIARDPGQRVLGLVSYAWAGFGAAFGPVVLFSLFWSRMTRNGALAGMVVGAVTVILWKQTRDRERAVRNGAGLHRGIGRDRASRACSTACRWTHGARHARASARRARRERVLSAMDPREDRRPRALAIAGPTASGKTAFALDCAARFDGEIVSVDSALVYRGLDIGAAKPDAGRTRARAAPPDRRARSVARPYSAAEFAARRARGDATTSSRAASCRSSPAAPACISTRCCTAWRRCPKPIRRCAPRLAAEAARARLAGAACRAGARSIPTPRARIHATDPQRIQRALEVYRAERAADQPTGSAARARSACRCACSKLVLAPARPRACCTRASNARFDAMLAAGFLDEVRALRALPDCARIRAARPAGDARGRLPPGLGAPRWRRPTRPTFRERAHRRHAPARQAPAHLAARRTRRALVRPGRDDRSWTSTVAAFLD